ncbi:hypothetical protein BDV95DRAFT_629382 [Massariosphaeria phaeospora]|uniref:F-box domain-containing protein n=1 Tax=Massariosphaeria phaeospora TaxID=100035 RepID=A0A7C8I8M3_9PLEO|nr:hypothetical protein BDV95DRAFT_629382 [Massariosphaeria phaeospora]
MDQLPQELVDRICSYLDAEGLRTTYNVSSKLRRAAEEHAEQHRTQSRDLTHVNERAFVSRYGGFRLRYLEDVEFTTSFGDLDAFADGYDCRESADEQHHKYSMLTYHIQDLFRILKMVEERAGDRNRGKYQLTIYSLPQDYTNNEYRCPHREHEQWRTHLTEPETLPYIMSVQSLELPNGGDRAKLDYRVVLDLISRFPNLECLDCHLGNYEWTPRYKHEPANTLIYDYDGPRRDTRHSFGDAIKTIIIPESLQHVNLDFLRDDADDLDHWKAMPNLVSPALKDPFSTSLRILSYHLKEITLRVQADETLFWPQDGSTPVWPHLQYIRVMFHMVSPSGTWYFEGPGGEGGGSTGYEVNESSYPPLEATEEDKFLDAESKAWRRGLWNTSDFCFRISPSESTLGPFLASFAKAAANMPALKSALLWSSLRWTVDRGSPNEREQFDYFQPPQEFFQSPRRRSGWGVMYDRSGNYPALTLTSRDPNCKARELWWKVGKWRPSPQLHDLFQNIGRREHGEALIEHWHDDEGSQRSVPQWLFEELTPAE